MVSYDLASLSIELPESGHRFFARIFIKEFPQQTLSRATGSPLLATLPFSICLLCR